VSCVGAKARKEVKEVKEGSKELHREKGEKKRRTHIRH
jgi:hypothetical protein